MLSEPRKQRRSIRNAGTWFVWEKRKGPIVMRVCERVHDEGECGRLFGETKGCVDLCGDDD